ncbi:MAG: hypothetical protein CMJ34_00525 [Phycisphaerae bacterium]|nr:hypothetical protein [Phycisphaerae bacterium]
MRRVRDGGVNGKLVPARPSPRFRRFFSGYAARMVRRRFHAARVLSGDGEHLARLDSVDAPVILLMTHASWWDPLVGLVIWRRFIPSRDLLVPMDASELERFDFFRRFGMFGIDPDDPGSLEAMKQYVLSRFEHSEDRPTLGLTPQGTFTDAREPIRLRPGAAAIAAASPARPEVRAVAVEYPFWQDKRPELLMSVSPVVAPTSERPTTGDWHRSMTDAMVDASERLAAASIARDPAAFEFLDPDLGSRSRINPIMDGWLRLRGRSGAVQARDKGEATT